MGTWTLRETTTVELAVLQFKKSGPVEATKEDGIAEAGKCFSMLTGFIEVLLNLKAADKIKSVIQQLWYMATLQLMEVTTTEKTVCGQTSSVVCHTLKEMRQFVAHQLNLLRINLQLGGNQVRPETEVPDAESNNRWKKLL